jgi:hypothetical protein
MNIKNYSFRDDRLSGEFAREEFDIVRFCCIGSGIKLRSYQINAARSIVRSVLENLGLSFAVMFPRQSGKNELQAQIECFLLAIFAQTGGEIVKISPT